MGFEDGCNTGLVLGLGSSCDGKHQSQQNDMDRSFPAASTVLETSLTLCLIKSPSLVFCCPDDKYKADKQIDESKVCEEREALLSLPHIKTVSSFCNVNIKREREEGSKEIELRMVSSRARDEDEEGCGPKKHRLTKEQSAFLEDTFQEHNTLNLKQKQALAKRMDLRPRQVEVWFQNRRARTKLKQNEVDCEFLKRRCKTLRDENVRLKKELQELKALKFASPLYMQLPSSNLTKCPSCESLATEENSKTRFLMAPKTHFFNNFTNSSAAC